MSYTPVSIYLCNPKTLKIKRRFDKMIEAAQFLGCSRQAIDDSIRTGHRVKGYRAIRQDQYHQYVTK